MWPERKVGCISFGSPRVGDISFSDWYNSIPFNLKYRFLLKDDPLPMFPSSNRFVHTHDAICLRHSGIFETWPDIPGPHREVPFGSLVLYIISVFVHTEWEYDDRFSHACEMVKVSDKRRGG